MDEVDELLSVPEAARRIGLTTEATYDLLFTRQLPSVESTSGRRLVPADAISEWLVAHPVPV